MTTRNRSLSEGGWLRNPSPTKIFTGERRRIFQSNLGNETQARSHGNSSRDAFEQALGCAVYDEFTLYQEAQERSKRRCGLL